MSFSVCAIPKTDAFGQAQVDALLIKADIERDANVDYVCGVFDDEGTLVATGSLYGATLRCLAVDDDHRGEGLMNTVVSHLSQVAFERGDTHLFLYTKPQAAKMMGDLGFYEIARVKDKLVFMENKRTGFADWLGALKPLDVQKEATAAIVMNANPFTLGHRYLVEQAAANARAVHLFVLSEAFGAIPPDVRFMLVKAGTQDLKNVVLHESGPYIISSATFPSYFLKTPEVVSRVHARLDLAVFCRIAQHLNIGVRYVGDEPASQLTALYNHEMGEALPQNGIACRVIKRLEQNGRVISASTVRKAMHDGKIESVRDMLPISTWDFFKTDKGREVIKHIEQLSQVVHH